MMVVLCTHGSYANTPTSPTSEGLSKHVSFELIDGLIVVEASIDGTLGNYILDTGSPILVLNRMVEDREFEIWTPQGSSSGRDIEVENFRFGMVSRDKLDAWALDLSYVERQINLPLSGIVGNQIWEDHQLIIDYKRKIITFQQEGDHVDISSDQYHIASLPWLEHNDNLRLVELEVNGRNRLMTLDTGASISVLDENLEDSHLTYGQARLDHVTIDRIPLKQSDLSTLNPPSSTIAVEGILSVAALEADIVVLDFSNDRLHFCWDKVEQ